MTGDDRRGLLEVRDLDVHLGQSHAVQGVSFGVTASGCTALLGRNGAGKTSTLRGLLGLACRSGQVRLDGEEIGALPTHRIVARGVGYVPEDREVFSQLTVADNLRLAERPGAEPRYDLVYELFPRLRERGRQAAGTLSGGEQQMLALGRALLNANRLLLIDEPTKGLAPNLVSEVTVALERASRISTCLLVEQNLHVVAQVAQDCVVLDQGRVVFDGDVRDLLEDPNRTRDLLSVGVANGWSRR